MKSINATNYTVFFNENGYENLNSYLNSKNYSKLFILTDENTNEHCLPSLLPQLATEIPIEIIEIEPGESEKNIATCVEIWSILSDLGADRKSVLLNLGGGVITDMGGFIAATFKRGIDFINVPTTLLGMVDASIGGKNGVDLGVLKNQIGTFTTPKLVVVDTSYLATLPQRELLSGLAEMLKHGLIFDKMYWRKFSDIKNINFTEFDQLIYRSIEIKNQIVTQDPSESGIRKSLNFGHTLGHAIESYYLTTKTPLLHGEAIAIGMLMEAFISKEKKLLSDEEFDEIKTIIASIYNTVNIDAAAQKRSIEMLIHDKKNEFGNVQFTLLNSIGGFEINQSADNEVIEKSFLAYKSK